MYCYFPNKQTWWVAPYWELFPHPYPPKNVLGGAIWKWKGVTSKNLIMWNINYADELWYLGNTAVCLCVCLTRCVALHSAEIRHPGLVSHFCRLGWWWCTNRSVVPGPRREKGTPLHYMLNWEGGPFVAGPSRQCCQCQWPCLAPFREK